MTLIEMVVTIVLTAILMAVAAPLIIHLVDGYTAAAAGADLVSASEPAIWQIQWDARNANHMNVNVGTTSCMLLLRQPNNTKIRYQYDYGTGQIFQILPVSGAKPVLLLSDLSSPSGQCPFAVSNSRLVTYDLQYQGPSGQGRLVAEGALSAYAP